ncbi:MAG: zinc ribbon domain-containing protein [Trichodesmium sp. MO_231.B1]|nr:zinc ribbon domain-containing protein [Trichodesmium sp. MO_231.B1]
MLIWVFTSFVDRREYKCELYGSSLIILDRWFPSSKTCSRCGQVKNSLSLSERVIECEHCGFSCARDLNASLNLASALSKSSAPKCAFRDLSCVTPVLRSNSKRPWQPEELDNADVASGIGNRTDCKHENHRFI